MTEPQLLFEESTHTYTLRRAGFADLILPSVTEIMEPICSKSYGNISERILDNAADRGTRIHRACEQYLKYGFRNVDDDCAGYFDGFLKFLADHPDWKPIHSEYRFYHKALLYAGTADLLMETPDGITLIDFKTTAQAHPKLWGVQLSAYLQGILSYCPSITIPNMGVVQLNNGGGYRLIPEKLDFNTFLACYTIFNFHED